jgi:hypothetical protein
MFRSQPLFGLPSQLKKPAAQLGEQTPLTHEVVPLALVHCVPHAPQLAVVLTASSQPFVLFMSQLPKPAVQVPSVQVPVEQDSLAFARSHGVLHAPQSDRVFSGLSQPLEAVPSQLSKPALHAPSVHVPEAQDSAALARLQTEPQAPQLDRVRRSVSQPFEARPSQLAKLALQAPS